MRFTIKEKNEETGLSVISTVIPEETKEFTLNEIDSNIKQLEKNEVELTAQIKYENAVKANIEEHHSFVKDFTDEQLHAFSMYWNAKKTLQDSEPVLERVQKVLKQEKEDHAEICKMLGVVTLDIKHGAGN